MRDTEVLTYRAPIDRTARRGRVAPALVALSLIAACGSGDGTGDEAREDDEPTVEEALADVRQELDRQAPGVGDDAIRIGITYLDTSSLEGVLPIEQGDFEPAYRAVIDQVNAAGGIHGRRIEPVFAPIDPISADSADRACELLTGREDVFLAMGYFQADALPCYLETYDTAVIGGPMTAEMRERATAPWFTADPGGDARAEVVRSYAESGALDQPFGVVALTVDEAELREDLLPLLDEVGADPAASAIITDRSEAGAADARAASIASVQEIAERFSGAGVQRVLTLGSAGAAWAWGIAGADYRPQLMMTDLDSADAYLADPTSDPSLLTGALAGSLYEGEQVASEPAMHECLATQQAAGVMTTSPTASPTRASDELVASTTACRNMALFRAIVERAGPDLTYGSFRRAGEGLGEMRIPGYPDPFHYGAAEAADGDPAVYMFRWVGGAEGPEGFVVEGRS